MTPAELAHRTGEPIWWILELLDTDRLVEPLDVDQAVPAAPADSAFRVVPGTLKSGKLGKSHR